MVKLSEADIREMLERRAGEFAIASAPSEAILRKAGRRKARNVVLACATTTLAIVAFGGLFVNPLGGSDRGLDPGTGGGPAAGGPVPQSTTGGHLRLVDYSLRAGAPVGAHAHAGIGPKITVNELRRHAECMRSQGFDVPEPTRQPGGGWSVIVGHAKARGLTLGSREFRKAWFVTCGPLGGPLSADMVIAGPRPKIDRFIACMGRQGFNLPEPTRDTSRSYDNDQWQFDLTRTSIDTSTPAWNRAMFVVCARRRM